MKRLSRFTRAVAGLKNRVALVLLLECWLVLSVLPMHTAASGTVMAWGRSDYGQTTVPGGLTGMTAIAAGAAHTLALKSDGTVVAWGNNASGQTTVPAGLTGITAVAASSGVTLALRTNGTVLVWGTSFYGQTAVPDGLSGVSAVAAGVGHALALKTDGTVVAWGHNYYGQTNIPADLGGVVAIAAGGLHTVVLVGTSPLAPTIVTTSTGNNPTLIWPTTAIGHRVESALSLTPTVTWNSVTGTFQTNGGSISIVLPMSGTQKFYRLVKP